MMSRDFSRNLLTWRQDAVTQVRKASTEVRIDGRRRTRLSGESTGPAGPGPAAASAKADDVARDEAGGVGGQVGDDLGHLAGRGDALARRTAAEAAVRWLIQPVSVIGGCTTLAVTP